MGMEKSCAGKEEDRSLIDKSDAGGGARAFT